MSQKKMEAYKEAKKNRREIEKKEKRKRILSWICGIVVTLVVVGGCGYLIYYSNVILPERQAAEAAAAISENSTDAVADDVLNLLNDSLGDDSDGVLTVPTDDSTETTSEAFEVTDEALETTDESLETTDEAAETAE